MRKIYALKREYFKLRNIKFDETYNLKNVSKNYAKQINKQISKYSNIDYIIVFEASLIAYLKLQCQLYFGLICYIQIITNIIFEIKKFIIRQ